LSRIGRKPLLRAEDELLAVSPLLGWGETAAVPASSCRASFRIDFEIG
jgi:hypothetical protein